MRHPVSLALWPILAAWPCAALQAQPVLTGKELNVPNLVEALSPAPAPAAEPGAAGNGEGDGIRLRSIRVQRDTPSARVAEQAGAAPAKKPSAALLITFVTNSAELTGRAKSSLDVVARALQDDRLSSFRFGVEGHADPRGAADDNLRLSQARADSVVEYLASQHHIARDRLRPVGKGDTEPMNRQQPDAPENRRVTIVNLRGE